MRGRSKYSGGFVVVEFFVCKEQEPRSGLKSFWFVHHVCLLGECERRIVGTHLGDD